MINRYAFLLFAILLSSNAAAEQPLHVGLDLMLGRSTFDVSDCRGDCAYVPDQPGDDMHLGLGTTVEKRFDGFGVGATLRVYDSPGKGEAFSRMIDAFVRLSLPVGSFNPYLGIGVSRQDYQAELANADGQKLTDEVTSPLYVLGVEKHADWGFWFVELAHAKDKIEVDSHRDVPPVPVSAEFDVERMTAFIGASINLAK